MDTKQGVTSTSVLPGALRARLTWAYVLSRPSGPKEVPHHKENQAQATLSCCRENTGVMKNKNTPLSFSHYKK